MIGGIYVDRWRYGTHSEAEIDQLMWFCDVSGIEDIFMHYHEDRAVSDNWDYLGYALRVCGKKRIHLWLSTTMGRDNAWTRTKGDTIKLAAEVSPKTYVTKEQEQGSVLLLNLLTDSGKKYFLDRLNTALANNPGLYGIHIEKMKPEYQSVIEEVAAMAPKKYLSLTFSPDNYFFDGWPINEAIPMLSSGFVSLNKDFGAHPRIALGCFGCSVEETRKRITELNGRGISPILYSYASFSSDPKEAVEDFIAAIQNVG